MSINPKNNKKPISKSLILKTIMNSSEDTIYFKDSQSKFIANSAAHARQMGITDVNDMVGKSDYDFFPEEFATAAYSSEQEIMRTGKAIIGHTEKWVQPDNTIIWLSASKYPLYNDNGEIIGTWGTSRDITDLKNTELQLEILNQKLEKANKILETLSIQDSLSGLFNHRHFYDSLASIESQQIESGTLSYQSDYSIIIIDLDNFKTINDTHGHLIGDFVIKQIGDFLNENKRKFDKCFRYGGDEFALIVDGNCHDIALNLAERIRSMIEDMIFSYNDITLKLTVSIGVACSSEADSINSLIDLADQRLYHSKESGRNRVT